MASEKEIVAYFKLLATPPPPGTPYSAPLPGSARPNRTAVYRHWRFLDSPLLETYDPSMRSLHDMFEKVSARKGNADCLGWRPWDAATRSWANKYEWLSYNRVNERRKNFGAGIAELHQRVGITEDKYGVGLWAQNCPEWHITELGLVSQSLWSVSLYETLGPEASEYILNHGALTCVVASLPHIPTLLKLAPRVPSLKLIISIDPLDAGERTGYSKEALLRAAAEGSGIQIFSMAEVEEIGAKSGRPVRPPQPDDTVTINYTSGTTGNPKGVVLTHKILLAALATARAMAVIVDNNTHFSYLPLAHIYGRMVDVTSISAGARIGYFHGDILALVDDLKLVKPDGFMSVPRLLNRFNAALQTATIGADGFKGTLSRQVVAAKKASMSLPLGQAHNKHLVYDRIWTPKVRAALGMDQSKAFISGSAQLDPDVHTFLRAALATEILQGWGMTETFAVGTIQFRGDYSTGNVGSPVPGIEMCLESVPDLEYTVEDKPFPRGELLVRGPVVFKEYYKNPEETEKTKEKDGWFHTGDIVEIDDMGRFRIIDRKKNVLKLSQGEYISPERIENVYMSNTNLITMAFVHGDPQQSALVGVFGFDPVTFAPFASKVLNRNISPQDIAALTAAANDPPVKKEFLARLGAIAKKHKFNGFEKVQNCYLAMDPFTVDNELLTPTLKLKRPQTLKAFRKVVDRLYEELEAEGSAKAKL